MIFSRTSTFLLALLLFLGPIDRPGFAQGPTASSQLPPIEYTFEAAQVHGNDHTSERFFLALLDLDPGQRVTVEALDRYRWRLMATGFFSQVETRLLPGSQPQAVILDIAVQERNTIRIRDIFFGLSADTPIWGGLEVAQTNLFGTGLLFSGGFVVSDDQGSVRTILADPFAATLLPFSWRLEGLYVDATGRGPGRGLTGTWSEEAFEYRRAGGRLGIGTHPVDMLDLRTAFRLEALHFDRFDWNEPQPETGILRGNSLLSTLSLQLQLNLGFLPSRPLEGFRFSLSGEGSGSWLGSDYQFLRLMGQLKHGFRVVGDHVLRWELLLGLLAGVEHTPYFEGFYIGNITTLVSGLNLGLQFTDRRSLDLLGNGADLVTYGDRFARLLLEWAIPLESAYGPSHRVEIYLAAGVFAIRQGPWEIGRHPDLVSENGTDEQGGYHLDLSFDLGIRGDTSIGFFSFSLGNVLALAPLN